MKIIAHYFFIAIFLFLPLSALANSSLELWQAARIGDYQKCATALKNKASINFIGPDGTTALWQAANNGSHDIIKLILRHSSIMRPLSNKPEPITPSSGSPRAKLLQKLKRLSCSKSQETIPTTTIAKQPDLPKPKKVSVLNSMPPKLKRYSRSEESLQTEGLAVATKKYKKPKNIAPLDLSQLCKDHEVTKDIDSPLHAAIHNHHIKAIKALLQYGDKAQTKEQDRNKDTPLNLAIKLRYKKAIEVLLKFGDPAQLIISDRDGNNPIHSASLIEEEDSIDTLTILTLIKELSCQENIKDGGKYLHWAINTPNNDGLFPLHIIIENNKRHALRVVELLAHAGAQLDVVIKKEGRKYNAADLAHQRMQLSASGDQKSYLEYSYMLLFFALNRGPLADAKDAHKAPQLLRTIITNQKMALLETIYQNTGEEPLDELYDTLTLQGYSPAEEPNVPSPQPTCPKCRGFIESMRESGDVGTESLSDYLSCDFNLGEFDTDEEELEAT